MDTAFSILELGIILLAAAAAGAVARRFGLPAVLGYLVIGLAVGPFTPGYVADRHQIQLLADVGVVLLLFEVGIELDLRSLSREPRGVLVAVPLQVAIVMVIGLIVLRALGTPPLGAVTLGLVAALSSSVVVVNITRSRARTTDAATERVLVVWAILQDVVTLVAATTLSVLLAPTSESPFAAFGLAIAFVAVAAVAQGWLIPRLLATVRDQHDSFLIVAVSAALAIAGLGAALFGVPIALSAFVAGLLFSTRPIAREARAEVLPFRDLFAVMFFVAIGTLVDPAAVAREPQWLALFVGLVVAKIAVSAGLSYAFRLPARHLQLGTGLGQIGEFSFVVLGLGTAAGVVTAGQSSGALAAAALTIAASALATRAFPRRGGPLAPPPSASTRRGGARP